MDRILKDLNHVIETKRLRLEITTAGKGKDLYDAIMDGYDGGIEWLNWNECPPTVEEVEIKCRKQHADFILRNGFHYIITDKLTDKVIGSCSLPERWTTWVVPQFGICYFIRKSERMKGYATEASNALAVFAFQKLGANKVEIRCDARNIISKNVPIKLGFQLECSYKGAGVRKDGTVVITDIFAVFSESDLVNDNLQVKF